MDSSGLVGKFKDLKKKKEIFEDGQLSIIKIVNQLEANTVVGGNIVKVPPGMYYAKEMLVDAGKRKINSVLIQNPEFGIPYIEKSEFEALIGQGEICYI